jgi:hypothetical protein
MVIDELINTKTCQFKIQTTFGDDLVCQEYGSGTSGHLMRYPPKGASEQNLKYFKFIVYPDKEKDGYYNLVVAGWPQYHVILESNRARLAKPKDSDYQRFQFKIAPNPSIEKDPSQEWYYLVGEAVKLHFDFASHRYVYPSNNREDRTKLKFVPVDIVEPDKNRLSKQVRVPDESPNQIKEKLKDLSKVTQKETPSVKISTEAIPAALINDDRFSSKIDQIKVSPYYYLTHEKLWSWKQTGSYTLKRFIGKSEKIEISSAFKSEEYESIKKTIGHTFDASVEIYGKRTGEVGVEDSGVSGKVGNEIGGSVKLAYQYKDQTEKIKYKGQSSEERFTVTETTNVDPPENKEDEETIYFWAPVDRYTLRDTKGNLIKKWDHSDAKSVIPFSY